jgi:hypothetical protein
LLAGLSRALGNLRKRSRRELMPGSAKILNKKPPHSRSNELPRIPVIGSSHPKATRTSARWVAMPSSIFDLDEWVPSEQKKEQAVRIAPRGAATLRPKITRGSLWP